VGVTLLIRTCCTGDVGPGGQGGLSCRKLPERKAMQS
jgi:hypothetical protein